MTETRIDEIADGIYRIATPVEIPGGAFSFNQYLIRDEAPMLFHTGPRRMFPLVAGAIAKVMPVERLRYVGLSHFEADECGAMNEFLAAAPNAVPVCGRIAAMTSVADVADRAPVALGDGETLDLGTRRMRWFETPHLPHGWECGHLHEETTRTLFCGDLFTQGGGDHAPVTEADILEPSEAFRRAFDYFAHAPNTTEMLHRLAGVAPVTLACMHGSAWRGDGAGLLKALAESVARV
jgi:flavorubredoxin